MPNTKLPTRRPHRGGSISCWFDREQSKAERGWHARSSSRGLANELTVDRLGVTCQPTSCIDLLRSTPQPWPAERLAVQPLQNRSVRGSRRSESWLRCILATIVIKQERERRAAPDRASERTLTRGRQRRSTSSQGLERDYVIQAERHRNLRDENPDDPEERQTEGDGKRAK